MTKKERYNEHLSASLKGKYQLKGDIPGLAWDDLQYGTGSIDFRIMEPEQADILIEKGFPYLERTSGKTPPPETDEKPAKKDK